MVRRSGEAQLLLLVLSILLPPLAVFLAKNACGISVIINIILVLLGYIPAVIHALYVVFSTNNDNPAHLD
jgi:uncharacterized membrane protein YqaE (UPF0057 family)